LIAILGGLGAAVAWATTTLCSARASRTIGALPTLAWVMLVGLVPAGIAVLAAGGAEPHGSSIGWLAVSGVGNVAGLGLVYASVRRGKVGVVAPIASTEGAVAAVIAVGFGEHLSPGVAAALGAAVVGVVLAASAGGVDGRTPLAAIAFACGAALSFGFSIYATGRVSQELSIAWAMFPARAVGVAAVTAPLLVLRRLPLPSGSAAPLVVVTGLAEVGGFAAYAVGARHGIAIAAVLASQFAAVSALGALVFYRERLTRAQVLGIVVIACAVAALSALRA
jgi:drug/metabolite transporter (DMT)-like permease